MTTVALQIEHALSAYGIELRPTTPADQSFLCKLYISTRVEELAVTNWSSIQIEAFLSSQFQLQHDYYHEHYTNAAFRVIMRNGKPIGRLYLSHFPKEIRIVDIALLPDYRGKGFGTAILNAILAEGKALHMPVSIHVERNNPALTLYTRLGFRQIEDKGVYYLLEKQPDVS